MVWVDDVEKMMSGMLDEKLEPILGLIDGMNEMAQNLNEMTDCVRQRVED